MPVQAVQPIMGGIAPTIDPTHVLAILYLFIGVYTRVYSPRLKAPNEAVRGFTPTASMVRPRDADITANVAA